LLETRQRIVLGFLSNEGVVATTIREELTSYESKNSRVSYSLASREGKVITDLSASLQGERTSKDRSDTRHQEVRIECNGMIVIPTRGVGNKRV
jgi:hypothetical protein